MAIFVEGDQLNTYLTDLIANADNFLWFISPYIKLNDRTKFNLTELKHKDETEIVIVFGKNENDLSKSVSLEDLNFFKEFPNVRIMHVKNLHAKYYGSEDFGIITSMNLYEFSQVNNLEAGVIIQPKNSLKKLSSLAISNVFDETYEDANGFFSRVIEQAQLLFQRKPVYKKTLLGLTQKYEHSETVVDEIAKYYTQKNSFSFHNDEPPSKSYQSKPTVVTGFQTQSGYCIRTGVEIPFNPARPFSYEAYHTWAAFSNWDYPESYCHKTGRPSNGNTSMRRPIL
jgi:phosphatidylserine/phosphatidylglycerophosphate/cardiolipin synthase-like enzyme